MSGVNTHGSHRPVMNYDVEFFFLQLGAGRLKGLDVLIFLMFLSCFVALNGVLEYFCPNSHSGP